jgi:phosphatidylcholine synthase
MPTNNFTITQKILAWSVHLFTASGILAGFLSILAINEKDWQMAMVWLIVALFIDGIDGTFARLFKVTEVLPFMDGKNIDYVIDFATYAIIPAYFFYATDLVEEAWRLPLAFLILMVSALYYGKEGMVEDEQYFIGFPVLWNMAIFYLVFVFQFNSLGNILMVITLSILHFVPVKAAYPSRSKQFKKMNILVSAITIFTMLLVVYWYPERQVWASWIMIFCVVYFSVLSVYETYIK